MNIIQRGRRFVQPLHDLARKSIWDWRRCPYCGGTETCSWGSYRRCPWTLEGRQDLRVPRHRCHSCGRTYSEQSPWLIRRSWYARNIHRYAIDLWQHEGSWLRRAAEFVRSLVGRQERWLLWRVLSQPAPDEEQCHLAGEYSAPLAEWRWSRGVADGGGPGDNNMPFIEHQHNYPFDQQRIEPSPLWRSFTRAVGILSSSAKKRARARQPDLLLGHLARTPGPPTPLRGSMPGLPSRPLARSQQDW